MISRPEYIETSETETVDLSPDGVDCIPVLGEHRYKRAGDATVPHVHPDMIEIICCRRGANLSFDCNGETVPFRPGTVFAAQPETPHFLRRYPKSLSTVWIWFRLPKSGRTALGLSRAETEWLVGRLRTLPVQFEATDALMQSFRRLWNIYRAEPRGTVARRLLMRDAATRLLLDVVESSAARAEDTHENEKLRAIIEDMRRNPSLRSSLCCRLAEGFEDQFLVFCRIAAAKEMLASTKKSVGAIAHDLGFPSAQHFATQFRRETGMTPLAWRSLS